jgi:Flp pilus assembly protein TadB
MTWRNMGSTAPLMIPPDPSRDAEPRFCIVRERHLGIVGNRHYLRLMSDRKSVYERLAAEQQAKSQRVLIWYITPLVLLAGLVAVFTGNGNSKFISAIVLGIIVLVGAGYLEWRKRRTMRR